MSDITPKKGMRIHLLSMGKDPNTKEFDPNPIKSKEEGEVDSIDSTGTIFVNWDNGRYFGVLPGVDDYILLPPTSDQIDLEIFEGTDKPVSPKPISKASKNVSKNFKQSVKIKGLKTEEELEETMTAGGTGGLAGASGYAFTPALSYKAVKPKKRKKTDESVIIKVKDLIKEETTTSAISATVDFLITNLMGWGTLSDMSPPWPSLTKKADNGKNEDWWWQKIPVYNGGVITDLTTKTDETWDDNKLSVDVVDDMSVFRKEIDKNPKKYKQSVIIIDKGMDLNIDPYHEDWRTSLQKGIDLKTNKPNQPIQAFNVMGLKKEDISKFTEDLLTETKKKNKKKKDKRIHTKKWDRCVKKVEEKNKENNTDYNPYAVCQSSIGYKGSILKPHRKKEDIEETTTFASVFGGRFPVGAAFAAKKGQHGPSKKPIWKGGKIIQKIDNDGVLTETEKDLFTEINKVKWVKGGKYVKIKDRCAKYNNKPWCSQGAIDNPLELSDNTFESIKNISEKTGLSEEYILNSIIKKLKHK